MGKTITMSGGIDEGLVSSVVDFLQKIGLPVRFAQIPEPAFLPGITIQHGVLTIDRDNLLHPGDLLHEAGHLAMLPRGQRAGTQGDTGDDGGFEMAAIAWSWAAALHLGLSPWVVFHDAGYRGDSRNILENFAAGRYIGVPLLEWAGLTASGERAIALGVEPYPAMLQWLRE